MKPVVFIAMTVVSSAAVPALACDQHEQASYPMQASAFQEKVNAKAAKIRARTEERLKESGASATEAKQERARVEAALAAIQAAAKKAVADGTVTADEAAVVKTAGRELWKHKKHGGDKT